MPGFTLSIVAPDRLVLEEPADSVILPGMVGYFGVQHGHEPIISALKSGYIEYRDAHGQRHFIAVSGGFAEVTAEKVSVLADTAERSTEIDVATAEADLERARQALRGEQTTLHREQAVQEIERATARIKVAKMN